MYAEADGARNTLLDIRKGQPILKQETEDSCDEHPVHLQQGISSNTTDCSACCSAVVVVVITHQTTKGRFLLDH